mgnify:CR=1 FL=1
MKECKKCNGVDINTIISNTVIYEGEEAYKEKVQCNNCGSEGSIIEYMNRDQIIYIGNIQDV